MSRNITRPPLASLAPNITAITPTTGTINQGNPNLEPVRADSSDLGVEWYFGDESLLAFTLFHKSIDSFIAQNTVFGLLSPEVQAVVATARPETANGTVGNTQIDEQWNINTPVNGEGATLNGYEIAYQQPIWGGFGVVVNFTHVESTANYGNGNIAPLEGLSEDSHNLTLYYEHDLWGVRVSVNERDDYITDATGADRNLQEATTGPKRVDASAFFNVTDQIKVTLEVINLTEEDERLYTTGPEGDLNLVREFNNTGIEAYLGARFNY
jgi:TonB-dependent receptor